MRVSIRNGVVFSHLFLAIIAVSQAFVFWIPVWKTTTVLRYQPKKGWYPIKSTGSGIYSKPKSYYNFHSPSHHHQHHHTPHHKKPHQFHSSFRHPYIHKYHVHTHHASGPKHHHPHQQGWKVHPRLNLNHHHPLCPLCHLANWGRPRKSHHPGEQSFFHHRSAPRPRFFSPSNIFPRLHHSPRVPPPFGHFGRARPFHSPRIHHSPKPGFFGRFSHAPPKFYDAPKSHNNENDDVNIEDDRPAHYPKTRGRHPEPNDYPSHSPPLGGPYKKARNHPPSISYAPLKPPRMEFPDAADFPNKLSKWSWDW